MNCPSDTEVGDIVAVFYNVDSPFVLRSTLPAGSENRRQRRRRLRSQAYQEERFKLIGDCFIQGIMELGPGNASRDGLEESECGEKMIFVII